MTIQEPSPRPIDRAIRSLRNHPEAILFLIGLLIFTGGLWSVVGGFLDPDDTITPKAPNVGPSVPDRARVGPGSGIVVGSYIEQRKGILVQRGAKKPRTASFAVVSFGTYRTPREVEVLLRANRLEAHEMHLRIPLPGFDPQVAEVAGRSLSEVVASTLGASRIEELSAELEELEKIIPTVTDADFRATYQADADSHRKAIALLRAGGGVIYGVVVKGSNANLAKVQTAAEVRLVDVPDEESANSETHIFVALMPEETERTGRD